MYKVNFIVRATNTTTNETIEQGFYSEKDAYSLENWLDTLGVAYEWTMRGEEAFPYERYSELV